VRIVVTSARGTPVAAIGSPDREVKRVKGGRVFVRPASENTAGHGTTAMAKSYQRELGESLQSAPRLAP
jgi:homoserine O-acetyltransferase/O-succinyltransferase